MIFLKIFKIIMYITIPLLTFVLYILYKKQRDKDEENRELIEIRQKKNYSKYKIFSKKADKIKLYLSQYGVEYMFGIVTPLQYYLVKIICTFVFVLFAIKFIDNSLMLLAGAALGWFLINICIKLSNDADNQAIASDIKNLYDTLRIQTRAGVYLISSLEECYMVVRNKRLKTALLQLRKEIALKHDISTAVEVLTIKFKNEYIDSFALIIEQSLRTGQSVKLLSDISKQMEDLEHSINLRKRHKIETKFMFCTMLVFLVIIFICMYAVMGELSESMNLF